VLTGCFCGGAAGRLLATQKREGVCYHAWKVSNSGLRVWLLHLPCQGPTNSAVANDDHYGSNHDNNRNDDNNNTDDNENNNDCCCTVMSNKKSRLGCEE
jgi:hypothetical protein